MSEENVQMCVARQRGILQSAAKMLRPGGRLVYSTCTFAEEERRGAGKRLPAFAPRNAAFGKPKTVSPPRGGGRGTLRRFLKRRKAGQTGIFVLLPSAPSARAFPGKGKRYIAASRGNFCISAPSACTRRAGFCMPCPRACSIGGTCGYCASGVRLGELKNGRFEPSHSLAMSLGGEAFSLCVRLAADDARTGKFLRGEGIEADAGGKGWCGVCVGGFPVGWGKAADGFVKNHIPKGLRL